MTLKEYNTKRNFKSTIEPKGSKISQKSAKNVKKSAKKLKFVIQYHKARANHYDFRLEWNGVLLSWAVPKGPSFNPKDKRLAVHVEDHPLDYANFEGIIPSGNYGAGSVVIDDSGNYEPSFDMEKGLKKGHLKFVLNGKKYKGEWSLVKIDEKNWLLIKSQDQFACAKKRVQQKSLPFKSCQVQLAQLAQKIPEGKDWIFEIKYDGYRMISYVEKGKARCVSRNGQDYTSKFSEIANELEQIDEDSFIVDGEVVAFDEDGRSDFGLLQNKIKSGQNDMMYAIFDLLALNGQDLRQRPLSERKILLNQLFSKEKNYLILSQFVEKSGKKCFNFAKKHNLEGIIAKKVDSLYSGSRNDDWLKIKCYCRQEFVICGWTTSAKNEILSALILGYYKDGKLCYAGKVGTGFDDKTKTLLKDKLTKISRKTTAISEFFGNKVDAHWAKPILVAEIQFAELTKDNLLRQASFIGLRQDKDAKNVILEKAYDR